MDKKTLLIAQILMTFMMALMMSGIMSLLVFGPTAEWLRVWRHQFLLAWPIAFVLTLGVSRIAFPLAGRLARLIDPA